MRNSLVKFSGLVVARENGGDGENGGDVGSKTTCEMVCERSKRFKDYIPMASRKPVWGVVEKCHFRDSPALGSSNLKSSLNLLSPFLHFFHLTF